MKFFGNVAPTGLGPQACGAAYCCARVLRRPGNAVVLLPRHYVKPCLKGHAAAIGEGMSRPGTRWSIKR